MEEKIASFSVNHDTLMPGIYLSRTDRNTLTYDLRFTRPNIEFLDDGAIHTLEHIAATRLRFSEMGDKVVYFGPMGCKTGFYLVVFDDAAEEEIIRALKDAFQAVVDFEGEIPGAKRQECGNYRLHSLSAAKKAASDYLEVIKYCTPEKMRYLK